MGKASRRKREPKLATPTTAVAAAPEPVRRGSLFLGIRRAIFDGTFAGAVAAAATAMKSSASTTIAARDAKVVDFFAAAKPRSSPTVETAEG